MEYKLEKNKILIVGKEDFNPEHIFECGQVFSYRKNESGEYEVLSADKKAVVYENERGFVIETDATEYFEKYFDLKTDYSAVKTALSSFEVMKKPIEYGGGIRILRQNLFETLISFIVSANNNIKRIKMILGRIRETYGAKENGFYAFPTRQQLLRASEDDFVSLGAGYRAKYLFSVLRQVDEDTLESWRSLPTEQLRKNLIALSGVGPKVADCVLLFGYGKGDVFPVDTWIEQMYDRFYSHTKNRQKIRENLVAQFGNLSGFAQQYLFFYMRAGE
jgi:N-glycosylase/DNA lyase